MPFARDAAIIRGIESLANDRIEDGGTASSLLISKGKVGAG